MTVTRRGGPGRPSHEWIFPTQAAARLGVPVRQVYRLIDTGALPAYRIADEIKLLADEVEAFARRSPEQ